MQMQETNKPFKIAFLIILIIVIFILLWNILRNYLIERRISQNTPITTISTAFAHQQTWQPYLYAIGTFIATNGVNISTQEAGNVMQINFQSGQRTKKGDLLVLIDDRVEQAQLQNNLAAMKLAEITLERNRQLAAQSAVSKQALDEATAKYQQAAALTAQTKAIIDYKHITAPFDGKLGIRNINLGQYVKPGDNIVPLQNLDPLYVNFFLPEKEIAKLYVGQPIELSVDSPQNKIFTGKINAINSLVDVQTHTITVQATIPNPYEELYPGLFARIKVILAAKKNVVVLSQTAINYTLYGSTVYIVKPYQKTSHIEKEENKLFTVDLRPVRIGEQKKGKVVILSGVKAGEMVVTSGQLKLNNGQLVKINNTIQP